MTIMIRMSEAMRLGAMLRPQAFNTNFNGIGSCAAAAADEATGVDIADPHWEDRDVHQEWTDWMDRLGHRASCPACGRAMRTAWMRNGDSTSVFMRMVMHLNDDHRWSREAIADWVEAQEIKAGLSPAAQVHQVASR